VDLEDGMTPQEQEDEKVRADLGALGRHVDHQLPYGWGFVVLAFPFGADGRMNYVSNANRADIVRAMYEFIEATKGKWGEHVPEGAAAEDEELGRARQRIAELEGILREMFSVMDIEHLIRFRHRLGKIGLKRMVKMFSEEIADREKHHGN
jgi:hypothetical protein